MQYMASHGLKRARPAELIPGTVSVITARMDYLPQATSPVPGEWQTRELARLGRPTEGIVSVYARGRDYHKVLRSRLQKLAERIAQQAEQLGHRAFTDSAPVLEAELAARSGQGWRGKHTLLLNREAGSMFFLGEIYIDLALPPSAPVTPHCGSCSACIDICPTQAIVAPHQLDARRCISYLTIELRGPIPRPLRPLLGDWVFGCDLCQQVCPYNAGRGATRRASELVPRLPPRLPLLELLQLTSGGYRRLVRGTSLRRASRSMLVRNAAVAMGNSGDRRCVEPLAQALCGHRYPLVRGHAAWALGQLGGAEATAALRRANAAPPGQQDAWLSEELAAALHRANSASTGA
ncbi:MAG: tRNA epoxyqueuosine(34) reductase QueG [Comamonadaceae bacterium]|nr:MAG: tRNA epoxyqueuosine(34) reductase QueG [Comamonadaceae bacterium]